MKLFLSIIDWVLFTSLFAAACAVGLCMATEKLLLTETPDVNTPLHHLLFGSTLLVYNAHFLMHIKTDVAAKGYIRSFRFWHWLFIIVGLLQLLFAIIFLPNIIIQWCGLLGVLAFMYSFPALPFLKKHRIKDYGWFKIIILVTVWTVATCILPILYHHYSVSHYPFEVLIRVFLLLALCVLFDVRDMQSDAMVHIKTIPNTIGASKSFMLVNISLGCFLFCSIIQFMRYPFTARLLAEITVAVVAWVVVKYVQKNPVDRVYLGLVDGVMMVYAVLVCIS